MANINNPEEKPKVSKLPLPISDSPLVIDLPDGQKIVIGKMTQGSVIEVATWRGVGRPDSRTSRLMLGVGNGNVNEEQTANAGQSSVPAKAKKPSDWRIVFYYLNIAFSTVKKIPIGMLVKKFSPFPLLVKIKSRRKKLSADKSEATSPSSSPGINLVSATDTVDEDFEAWLSRISEKASTKAVESKAKAKSPIRKSAPVKKTVKRAATSKSKRK